ncbi:hypothetical protein J7M23_06905 [Candidatus Sumerlaeota bacterium]|nr:hypothetical protein [Candidatus Sumerlaeota bacterium]
MNDEEKKEELKQRIGERISSLKQEVIECVLKAIPPEVAEHLGNSKKELLMAIRSLIDTEIKKIDKTVERVKELHQEKE